MKWILVNIKGISMKYCDKNAAHAFYNIIYFCNLLIFNNIIIVECIVYVLYNYIIFMI